MADYTEFAKEIHMNAVAHGFWDDPDMDTKIALIHAEWSEALEEYRAGRDAVWHGPDGKPEGWAVELVDGVIRILDIAGSDVDIIQHREGNFSCNIGFGSLIYRLHVFTANHELMCALGLAMGYLREKGMDADELMREKHEYNKGRPYKHGKKF